MTSASSESLLDLLSLYCCKIFSIPDFLWSLSMCESCSYVQAIQTSLFSILTSILFCRRRSILLVALAASRVEQRSQLFKFTSFLLHFFFELL